MFVVPADTINLEACSKLHQDKLNHFLEPLKNPLVGLGVVGTNTLIKSSLTFFIAFAFLVANPTAQTPFLGILVKQHFFAYYQS